MRKDHPLLKVYEIFWFINPLKVRKLSNESHVAFPNNQNTKKKMSIIDEVVMLPNSFFKIWHETIKQHKEG